VAGRREILTRADYCDLAERWSVHPGLMFAVQRAAHNFLFETGREVWIISGYRTRAEQDALRRAGNPAASEETSTHRVCPATGVDVSLGFGPTKALKMTWGRLCIEEGLRWGGGSPLVDNIPTDWNHVDLGPRRS
jgi:hypothetical protein